MSAVNWMVPKAHYVEPYGVYSTHLGRAYQDERPCPRVVFRLLYRRARFFRTLRHRTRGQRLGARDRLDTYILLCASFYRGDPNLGFICPLCGAEPQIHWYETEFHGWLNPATLLGHVYKRCRFLFEVADLLSAQPVEFKPALDIWREEHPYHESYPPAAESDLYFIRCQTTNLIKIGVSTSVEDRLRTLQTASPGKLVLLGVVKHGGVTLEEKLHERLKPHRSHGEWFRDSPELQAVIKRLCREAA